MQKITDCILCKTDGEEILFTNNLFRIIHVNDSHYPGFIRLILNQHIAEMTDLEGKDAHQILSALLAIEKCMRDILNPDKINLASLGNMMPHLHWHIIPRYKNDRHFPNPIWGEVVNPKYFAADNLLHQTKKLIKFLATEQIFTTKFTPKKF